MAVAEVDFIVAFPVEAMLSKNLLIETSISFDKAPFCRSYVLKLN